MALTISASTLLVKRYLKVKDRGVKFYESAIIGATRTFKFSDIEFVLMSPTNVLSVQVDDEVFSIQTKLGNAKHEMVIQKLLERAATDPAPVATKSVA